jgi:hypothetical protein
MGNWPKNSGEGQVKENRPAFRLGARSTPDTPGGHMTLPVGYIRVRPRPQTDRNNSITGFTVASIAVIVLIFAAALLGAFIFMKHWP